MVVAVATMAGFLYWVYQEAQSVESSLQPTMQDTASATEGALTRASLAADPGGAVGRSAALDSVEVSQNLGRAVFTVILNDSVDYPILMDGQLLQRGATVYGGDRVTVEGQFYSLNDSIVQEWVSRGAVDSESRENVPAVASFMLADSLDIQE
jgi:hypothetical protein